MVERGGAISKGDRAAIRQLHLIFVETTSQSETRNFQRVLETIKFLFLDGKQNGLFVE